MMAVLHNLICSDRCGDVVVEARVERRTDGVLDIVEFGSDPVRAICDRCGADLEVVLTGFSIGNRAMAVVDRNSGPVDGHDWQPRFQADASRIDPETGRMTELGRLVLSTASDGCVRIDGGPEVQRILDGDLSEGDRDKLN